MKQRLFYFLKNYFGFSRRESRGFLLVLPALCLLYFIPSVYDYFLTRNHAQVYQEYVEEAEQRLAKLQGEEQSQKMEVALQEVSPRANLDTARNQRRRVKSSGPELNKINFSEADSIVLQIVPGIGSTLAGRIVRFRENMGGLHSRSQLMEVYGLSDEVVERLFDYFDFTPSINRKLPINELNEKELSQHPYINYGQAKVIVAYREQHGHYKSKEDLLKIKIFTEAWLHKLEPYLSVP